MGEYSLHGTFYVPDIGESNTNKGTFDDALDEADRLIQMALQILAGCNSTLPAFISNAIVGRYQDASLNTYFSTEVANGGNIGILDNDQTTGNKVV